MSLHYSPTQLLTTRYLYLKFILFCFFQHFSYHLCKQKVRKEHIGGDVVVMVFMKGDAKFSPDWIATPTNCILLLILFRSQMLSICGFLP